MPSAATRTSAETVSGSRWPRSGEKVDAHAQGSDLGDRLVDVDVDAGVVEAHRRDESTDAGADDDRRRTAHAGSTSIGHHVIPPPPRIDATRPSSSRSNTHRSPR